VTASEAARHDLYNGLTEVLGPQRAETLMAAISAHDTSQLVTKEEFRTGMAELRVEMSGLRAEFKSDLHQILLALVGGLIVILGAMVGLAFVP
jgi:hypothetical protein